MERIPKTIHYIWFGHNPKPEIVLKCIESWKRYMPGYEIKEWNEDNYDYRKADYPLEAYEAKKWAFVSDFARFDILQENGGIYFDTDVELMRPIPEDILDHQMFMGFESAGLVNPGLVLGTVAGHPFLEEVLKNYRGVHFDVNNLKTVNQFTTEILAAKGLMVNGSYQMIGDIAIYPSEIFCGYDQDVHDYDITDNTVSVHHYARTWKKATMSYKLQKAVYKLVGKKMYKTMLNIKRNMTGGGYKKT